mmetsp:Transcript_14353/g.28337  ORF Transcript_14353/g.28337 Transcript_14353/m.28337 type:complete len:461 (+) Transcript_14353:55-1437(+)
MGGVLSHGGGAPTPSKSPRTEGGRIRAAASTTNLAGNGARTTDSSGAATQPQGLTWTASGPSAQCGDAEASPPAAGHGSACPERGAVTQPVDDDGTHPPGTRSLDTSGGRSRSGHGLSVADGSPREGAADDASGARHWDGGAGGAGALRPTATQPHGADVDVLIAKPRGSGKRRFQSAVRAVIQEDRLRKAERPSDRLAASIRHQTEVVKIRSSPTARLMSALNHTLFKFVHTPDAEPLSDAEKKRLQIEFSQIDRDHMGTITVKQLEKLLVRRAYLMRKAVWRDTHRHRTKSADQISPSREPPFNYCANLNKQDRKTATMAATDAFKEYSCLTDGMDFDTFCRFHLSLHGARGGGGGGGASQMSEDWSGVFEDDLALLPAASSPAGHGRMSGMSGASTELNSPSPKMQPLSPIEVRRLSPNARGRLNSSGRLSPSSRGKSRPSSGKERPSSARAVSASG